MRNYKGYLIDLDGTIYHGKNTIEEGKAFVEYLKQHDIPYLFVTNNSTKSALNFAVNLTENHGILTTADQIYTSAMATADFLDQLATAEKRNVYMIGENGLKEALLDHDFSLITPDENTKADFVVMGYDSQLTYEKLTYATLAIESGAQFIVTNRDSNLPSERGMLPGAGAAVAAVVVATGVEPTVVAKPNTPIMDGALAKIGLNKEDVVMVGDNYDTDILAGINFDIDTLLVYTGVSTKEYVHAQKVQPTHELDSLAEWFEN